MEVKIVVTVRVVCSQQLIVRSSWVGWARCSPSSDSDPTPASAPDSAPASASAPALYLLLPLILLLNLLLPLSTPASAAVYLPDSPTDSAFLLPILFLILLLIKFRLIPFLQCDQEKHVQ